MFDMQYGDVMPVLDHGYVKLLDVMGTDESVVDAARISYDRRGRSEDRALIRYLLRHPHTTPFEMAVLKFEVKMPIFVARQWIRHRTASINEMSARYTELPEEMFVPEVVALQSTDNKQGRQQPMHTLEEDAEPNELKILIGVSNQMSYTHYQQLLDEGVARELARGVLPVNIYTKFIWKMDLHNLMHFMDLRLDPHAQEEIRVYAELIEKMVALKFPMSHEAFVDYVRDSYTCSRMEVELIRKLTHLYQAKCATDAEFAKAWDDSEIIMTGRELTDFKKVFFDV